MAARTKARKRALDLLFEAEQRGVDAADLLRERLAAPVTEAALSEFTADLVMGVVDHLGQLDELIATYSQGWTRQYVDHHPPSIGVEKSSPHRSRSGIDFIFAPVLERTQDHPIAAPPRA